MFSRGLFLCQDKSKAVPIPSSARRLNFYEKDHIRLWVAPASFGPSIDQNIFRAAKVRRSARRARFFRRNRSVDS
jgi:hypothetical protein